MPGVELGRYLMAGNEKYHACIEACVECLVACDMCSEACLHEKDVTMTVECIRLDRPARSFSARCLFECHDDRMTDQRHPKFERVREAPNTRTILRDRAPSRIG